MRGSRRRWAAPVAVATTISATACTGSSDTTSRTDPTEAQRAGSAGSDAAKAHAALDDIERAHLVGAGETTWDVEYSDDTIVVDGDTVSAALTSTDDQAYTFDTAALDGADISLVQGAVVLLAGRALRRITSVESDGDHTVATTEPASLSEAIDSGTVGWDVPIEFGFDQFVTAAQASGTSMRPHEVRAAGVGGVRLAGIAMRTDEGDVIPVTAGSAEVDIKVNADDGNVEWTYGQDGNKYQFRLTSRGDAVDILVVVSRESGGDSTMAFRAEGSMGAMRSVAANEFADGQLDSSTVDLRQLASDLDLSLSVAGAGTAPVDFTVPVPMLTYTWLVGPVPVTMDITTEIIGKVDAQANASATAEASFGYRGDVGLAFEGAQVSSSGATDVARMDPEPADSAAAMGLDVDAQFGVAFPHVSLSILGQGLVPELRAGAVIGSNLQWGGPAAGFPASSLCKTAYVRMEVSGGYDFKVLGQSLTSDEFELYKDENKTRGDSCPQE